MKVYLPLYKAAPIVHLSCFHFLNGIFHLISIQDVWSHNLVVYLLYTSVL